MDRIRVRAYNVLFGDALLVTVPDRDPASGTTTVRHILIDVGNALTGKPGKDTVFEPVVTDILKELDGVPLDLYVMTHEHMDHVQGLPYVAKKVLGEDELRQKLQVSHAWFTASAAPGYRTRFAAAGAWWDQAEKMYETIRAHLAVLPEEERAVFLTLLEINNVRSTRECVDYLRSLTGGEPAYIHRESDLAGTHPFREVQFRIWAPEEDTAVYLGKLLPLAVAAGGIAEGTGAAGRFLPPAGVDAGAFFNLVTRRAAAVDNLLQIDAAGNNTSLVFSMEWRGWKLLFTGDAEHKSWEMMAAKGVLEPVHFLKVSHHCSATGMPDDEVFDRILPPDAPDAPDGVPRQAAVSTCDGAYRGIPDTAVTGARLAARCTVRSTFDAPDEPYQDFFFEDGGG